MSKQLVVAFVLTVLLSPAAWSQTPQETSENTLVKIKQDRVASLLEHTDMDSHNSQKSFHKPTLYTIEIGVYGMYEPSIYPDKTWVWLACFSTPGKSYDGFSLVWVDIVAGLSDDTVWDSREGDNDRGICDINQGVDTTFIEIPRTAEVLWWLPIVDHNEQRRKNIQIGRFTAGLPYVYNRQLRAVSE